MSVFSKTSAKWIDMESTVPSLKIISVVIAFAILIFFHYYNRVYKEET